MSKNMKKERRSRKSNNEKTRKSQWRRKSLKWRKTVERN
jgi:hypothetical protein